MNMTNNKTIIRICFSHRHIITIVLLYAYGFSKQTQIAQLCHAQILLMIMHRYADQVYFGQLVCLQVLMSFFSATPRLE